MMIFVLAFGGFLVLLVGLTILLKDISRFIYRKTIQRRLTKSFVDFGDHAITLISILFIACIGFLVYKFLISFVAFLLSTDLVSFFVLARGVFTIMTELQDPFTIHNFLSGFIFTPALQFVTLYLVFRSIKTFMISINRRYSTTIYKESDVLYGGFIAVLFFMLLETVFFSQDISPISSIAHFTFLLSSKISYIVYFLTIVHLHFLRNEEYILSFHDYLRLKPIENLILFSPWRLLLVTLSIGVILNLPFYFGIQFSPNNWLIILFFLFACTIFYFIFKVFLSKGFNYIGVVLLSESPVDIIPNTIVFDKNREKKILIALIALTTLYFVFKFKYFFFTLFFLVLFSGIYAVVLCFVYLLGLGLSVLRSVIFKYELPTIRPIIIQEYIKNVALSNVKAITPLFGIFLFVSITISLLPKKFDNRNGNYVKSVFDKNGQLIFRESSDNNECIAIAYPEIPEFLIKCLILREDRDFMKQKKLFPARFLKTSNWHGFSFASFYRFAKNGGGGSNINMQLMKNAALPSRFPQDIQKKISEMITSFQLSNRYTPEEIATFYLNRVSFNGGKGHSGIMAGSLYTFALPVMELNNLEMLYLVSSLNHSSHFKTKNRLVRYEDAENYSKEITSTLITLAESWYKQNLISKKELQSLKGQKLRFSNKKFKTNCATTTNLFLSREMNKAECSGTTFVTSISKTNQQKMFKAIKVFEGGFKNVMKRNNYTLYSSAIVVNVKTGEIIAHHGGIGVTELTRFSDGNQIASLIKPFVLLELLEKGFKANEIMLFDGKINERLTPNNLNRKYINQKVGINRIIKESLNAPLTNIDQLTNPIDVFMNVENRFSKMNISKDISISLENTSKKKEYEMNYPLGSRRMTLYEVAQIYQTLFNDGKYIKLHVFNSYYDPIKNKQSIIDTPTFEIYNLNNIKKIKSALLLPLLYGGTAQHIADILPKNKKIYAKTGTSDKSIHGYTVLCDNNILVVAWTSYGKITNNRLELNNTPPLPYNSGVRSAGILSALIFNEFYTN